MRRSSPCYQSLPLIALHADSSTTYLLLISSPSTPPLNWHPHRAPDMFKKLLKGLDSTPPTPKIGRMELPEVGEGDVYYFS